MEHEGTTAVAYARRLYDDVLGWYVNADTKAQVVLTIDGAFLAFITSAIFGKPDDLKDLVERFSPLTWSLLTSMTACLIGSIVSALNCLRSRIYTSAELAALIGQPEDGGSYPPERMWFFQFVGALNDVRFLSTLRHVDAGFEIEAMAAQAQLLSRNVHEKHRAVNRGFVLGGATLVLFFLAGLSYMAGVIYTSG